MLRLLVYHLKNKYFIKYLNNNNQNKLLLSSLTGFEPVTSQFTMYLNYLVTSCSNRTELKKLNDLLYEFFDYRSYCLLIIAWSP